jgi:hypothetical protein
MTPMPKFIAWALLCLCVSSCATDNELKTSGMSPADGIVQLSIQYELSDRPVIDSDTAQNTARERCSAWGYSDAQRFEPGQQQCLTQDIFGHCKSYNLNLTYHCTGG